MFRIIRYLLLLILFFGATQLQAQIIQDPTTWAYEVKKKNDSVYDLVFKLNLKEHWHIWSLNPGGDGLQIPPEFNFDGNPDIKLIGKPKEKGANKVTGEMDGVDGIVTYFLDKVEYVQSVLIKANTIIKGEHRYQVCDEKQCLAPTTKAFKFEITNAALAKQNAESAALTDSIAQDSIVQAADTDTAASSESAQNDTEAPVTNRKERSLLILFLLCFGGGLAAIVTPCVFSMIPITVSFFTKRSKTRKEGIKNALYYAASIVIIFTVLGIAISVIFGPAALYKISTNWILNLVFFAMFLVFGISFLGAFEITLPSSWTSKTDSKAGLGSFTGIFFMALTLVIVSFSCTGPILGMLVVYSTEGGLLGPMLGMFAFSLGFALPFAFFALFPGLLNKLGSAGGWLNQVKVTLGFLELGLALKFLSNADLVMQWRLLDREIFLALWIVIAVLLGLYLLGKLKFSHDDASVKNVYGQEYISIFRLFVAIASFSFALYLLPGMWGAPLKALGTFIPPMGTQDFVINQNGVHNNNAASSHSGAKDGPVKYVQEMSLYEPDVVKSHGLQTYFDYEEALEASKKFQKPVMLDFTGITCVNCRKMETQVWANPEVMKRLKSDFIIASLYCDATQVPLVKGDEYISSYSQEKIETLGEKSLDIQITQFKSNSQPFYFFVDGNGKRLVEEGYGYDPDVEKFIKHLDKAKVNYQKKIQSLTR